MTDISKRLEKAERYLQKGKPEAALEEYLLALDEDPRNDRVRQKRELLTALRVRVEISLAYGLETVLDVCETRRIMAARAFEQCPRPVWQDTGVEKHVDDSADGSSRLFARERRLA